jgi:RNA polymerase sigma factor (sigma-70 family)
LKISNELWRPDKFVTEAHEDIDGIPSSKSESNTNENPEIALENKNLESKGAIIENSLEKALQGLSPEDSLMLKLRFTSQKSVSEISRLLGQSRKVVERKIRGLLNRLKDILLSNGINYDEVSEMIKTRYG